jgi:hypothetical protein
MPRLVAKLKDLAPYAALELVMPGGSVMALLLWFYRRQRNARVLPTNTGKDGFVAVGPKTHGAQRLELTEGKLIAVE